MKSLFAVLVTLFAVQAFAFSGQDQFKVELVRPMGEFGFRALGKGKNLTEMHFDCRQATEMGIVVTTVNSYGKTGYVVLPAGEFGSDKQKCQQNLKKYFAGLYNKRGVASTKGETARRIDLEKVQGIRKLSFR